MKKWVARCTSDYCAGKHVKNKAFAGVVVDVPYRKLECPVCHHILFWRQEDDERKVKFTRDQLFPKIYRKLEERECLGEEQCLNF